VDIGQVPTIRLHGMSPLSRRQRLNTHNSFRIADDPPRTFVFLIPNCRFCGPWSQRAAVPRIL